MIFVSWIGFENDVGGSYHPRPSWTASIVEIGHPSHLCESIVETDHPSSNDPIEELTVERSSTEMEKSY